MLEKYYVKPQTLDRIRAHWLGEPVERYVTWLHEQGYGARNVFRRVPLLLRFGATLRPTVPRRGGIFLNTFRALSKVGLDEHAVNSRTERARKSVSNAVRGPIEQMLRLLLPDFAMTGRRKPFPFTDEAPGFVAHLIDERGLRPTTLHSYRQFLRTLKTI